MFRRRAKPSIGHRILDVFWPRIGWRRWFIFTKHKIGRMSGSPHAIAGGFAFGAAISFTPFLLFHLVLSVLLSKICRMSGLAAFLGTLVGNPWTFPFIWVGIYAIGIWITGIEPIAFDAKTLSAEFLVSNFWSVFVPMTVGGMLSATIVWVAFYFPIRGAVVRYRKARNDRILRTQIEAMP